jgi:serine protease Do
MQQTTPWKQWGLRAVMVPTTLALGAVAFTNLRGNAGQTNPPVQPPAQVVEIQNAFEKVADKLRPSVVFIQSRRSVTRPSAFGGDDGEGGIPFDFFGAPGGGRQFRQMPQMPRRAMASGSGVIVRGDGYILTNDHVVQGADKVTVRLQDGRELVGQVKRDFKSDLALIKVEATGLPAAELADSDKTKIGQWGIAFGSPFGLNDTMTVGIVSSMHRNQAIGAGANQRYYSSLIQTDASINPGNSGGPLVDIYGRVIGINVAIESPSGGSVGIGFAIPANTAKYVMDQLITKGSVTRGYLGLAPKPLTFDEQKKYGVNAGVLVASVQDGTPASKAGFQVEDVIVRFNNQPVTNEGSFRDMVARTAPGTAVPVVIERDGKETTLQVTIGEPKDTAAEPAATPDKPSAQGKLGVSIADVNNPDARKQFNLKENVTRGALIVEVAPGSPAAAAGLQPGDVLLRLNGKTITDSKQLPEIVQSLKEGASATAVVRRGDQTVLAEIEME